MSKHTPGPWIAANMVNKEGQPMSVEEIGAYVMANVSKSIEDGGSAERFLFITTAEDDGPDICHVGNGPRGPYNARLIAAAPDLLDVARQIAETSKYGSDTVSLLLALNRIAAQASAVIAKAEGR